MKKGMVLASALVVASCTDINVSRKASGVIPVGGGQTAQVTADDLVLALGRSGFTPEEILQHGPAIRNALAVRGGAEVRQEGRVTAILSIVDGALYVVSQRGGTYVHELYA